MRIPEPVYRAWTGMPFPYQAAIVVALLAVLLVAAGGASVAVSHWKDRRFDAAEGKRAAERQTLADERDAALRRAEAAEAKAGILEEQAKALRQVADSAALTAKQSQARADQIAKETETSVASIGDVAPEVARQEIHDRLVRLGLLKE